MNKEPSPQSAESKRDKNAEIITSSLTKWFESKNSNEPAREGDFQFAADLLESAIYDKSSDFQLVVSAVEAPVKTCDIIGSVGDNLDVSPSARGPLNVGQKLPLQVIRKIFSPRLGGYAAAKNNVYVGTYAQYVEMGELARAVANNDAEISYESPIREKIKQQWDEVVAPHIAVEKKADAEYILNQIMEAYSEEGRAHHNLEHIAECFEALEPYKDRDDYLQLWFTLLMHDETYNTHAHDNEEVSADNAVNYMRILGLPGADDVQRLIISTKYHAPENEDEQLICSIDMSILAAPTQRYDRYARAIRKEYDWVDEQLYVDERIKVLRTFKKPFTHPDFEHLNDKAYDNLAREISELSSSSL